MVGGVTISCLLVQVAFDRNVYPKAIYADLRGAIVNNAVVYPCMRNKYAGSHLKGSPLAQRAKARIISLKLKLSIFPKRLRASRFGDRALRRFYFPALLYNATCNFLQVKFPFPIEHTPRLLILRCLSRVPNWRALQSPFSSLDTYCYAYSSLISWLFLLKLVTLHNLFHYSNLLPASPERKNKQSLN